MFHVLLLFLLCLLLCLALLIMDCRAAALDLFFGPGAIGGQRLSLNQRPVGHAGTKSRKQFFTNALKPARRNKARHCLCMILCKTSRNSKEDALSLFQTIR